MEPTTRRAPTRTRPSRAAALPVAAREDACLAFANTLSWRGSEAPVEALGDFAALLAWCKEARVLPAPMVEQLAGWTNEHPPGAAELLAETIALREVIHAALSRLAEGKPVAANDFAALSRAIAQAPARRQLVRTGEGYAWRIGLPGLGSPGPGVADLLAPVLWSAADLLAGGAHRRLRRCANRKCLWLFLDASKSGTRRWCDMASCGNRAKAQRHYLKVRQG